MDISEDDVRIKSDNVGTSQSMEKLKTSPFKTRDVIKKSKISAGDVNVYSKKGKPISRSQSVTSSQTMSVTIEPNFTHDMSASTTQLGSFSTTTTNEDLGSWKQNADKRVLKISSPREQPEEPILTVASNDSSKVTIGFNVNDEK